MLCVWEWQTYFTGAPRTYTCLSPREQAGGYSTQAVCNNTVVPAFQAHAQSCPQEAQGHTNTHTGEEEQGLGCGGWERQREKHNHRATSTDKVNAVLTTHSHLNVTVSDLFLWRHGTNIYTSICSCNTQRHTHKHTHTGSGVCMSACCVLPSLGPIPTWCSHVKNHVLSSCLQENF